MLSPQQGIERRALVTLSLQQCMRPRLATVAPASPGHRSAAHPELPSRPLRMPALRDGHQQQQSHPSSTPLGYR